MYLKITVSQAASDVALRKAGLFSAEREQVKSEGLPQGTNNSYGAKEFAN